MNKQCKQLIIFQMGLVVLLCIIVKINVSMQNNALDDKSYFDLVEVSIKKYKWKV